MTRTATNKPPKGIRKLSETEQAKALHAFHLHDGDLKKTKAALGKRFTLRTLTYYRDACSWQVLHEEFKSDIVREAVQDAKKKRLADLEDLRLAKSTIIKEIRCGLVAKTLGEAVKALCDVIRLEREIVGNADGADDDVIPGLLRFVADAARSGREAESERYAGDGGNGDNGSNDGIADDDPFGLRDDTPDRH